MTKIDEPFEQTNFAGSDGPEEARESQLNGCPQIDHYDVVFQPFLPLSFHVHRSVGQISVNNL